jgi:hypothetical protein
MRIVPVNEETKAQRLADQNSLIKKLERTGKLKTATQWRMFAARRAYVQDRLEKQEAAKAAGVSRKQLETWILMLGWDELREKREFELFQKVLDIRHKAIPDIDEKHDRMFHHLESLIEDTIHRIQRDETEVKPRDLSVLATAAKSCMDARRTVHKKEGQVSKQVVELQGDRSLFDSFAAMLQDTATKPQLGNPEKRITIDLRPEDNAILSAPEDADFETQDEIEDLDENQSS